LLSGRDPRAAAALRRGGGCLGAGDARRSGGAVRATCAHPCAHRGRPATHLLHFGCGLMAIEGPLRELGIHDVFQLLDLSRKTGVLRVASELRDDEGVVHFDSGRVVHAHVKSKAVPLELTLLQSGKISKDDLESARAKRSNGRADADIVDLLVEGGAVTPKEIERQLRMQIESVVFELMSWREGFFSFEERAATGLTNTRENRIRVWTESL